MPLLVNVINQYMIDLEYLSNTLPLHREKTQNIISHTSTNHLAIITRSVTLCCHLNKSAQNLILQEKLCGYCNVVFVSPKMLSRQCMSKFRSKSPKFVSLMQCVPLPHQILWPQSRKFNHLLHQSQRCMDRSVTCDKKEKMNGTKLGMSMCAVFES